jgi:hypothetical protein
MVSGAKNKSVAPTTYLGITPHELQYVGTTRIASGTHHFCTIQAKLNKKCKQLFSLSSVPTDCHCLILFLPVILLIGHHMAPVNVLALLPIFLASLRDSFTACNVRSGAKIFSFFSWHHSSATLQKA